MGLILNSNVWEVIGNTFANVFSQIGQTISTNAFVAILTFAILLILIVYRTIRNNYTSEIKTYKAITRINDYLATNPFITEENLVEFNRLMMKCPKTIRFQWQRYIINRNKKPSDFLTEENVIERPFRTNSYKQGLKSFSLSVGILCLFSAVFMIASHLTPDAQVGKMILSLVTPAIALFVGGIYTAFSRVLYNTLMSDLYFSFTNFEKGIDRAVANMPEAIDYEIIFTPKEIQNGIPALQEYLEQRALYEQEQIKRAQESEVRHEIYNFDALGVNGSLVMQRAIKESEIYLGNKKRLENEIEVLNADKNNEQKKFDDENRMRLRNLRDIRETISGLKNKIEMASNEISKTNYRRQQSAEVEKEQNLEKEIKKATDEFNKKVSKLDKEIDGKNQEIQDCKNSTEKALIDEFKHFFEKINKDSEKFAKEKVENEIKSLERERDDLNALLEEKDKLMAEKLSLYEDKVESFDAVTLESQERFNEISDLKAQLNELNQEIDNKNQEIFEVKQELESRKREILKKDETIENYKNKNQVEVYRYFDANGTEFYFDENDNPYYLDEEGNPVYYNQEPQESFEESVETVEEEYTEETLGENPVQPEPVEEVVEEKPKKARKSKKAKKEVVEESVVENKEDQETVEEDGYVGIQETLNKLAKAAEEKMQAEKTKKAAATKKSSNNKSTAKKASGTPKSTASKKSTTKKKKAE